eukprot:TRINITY_DN13855_c0_g1_i1.p1 TRINITY_DN13855_c0_g1~~TRINITY_DN13855_c0_g1_i1.p1  ORF type:complete len:279 (+),score=104.39 TRINITY_DN13855_c0_g1_i1:57-893(+)
MNNYLLCMFFLVIFVSISFQIECVDGNCSSGGGNNSVEDKLEEIKNLLQNGLINEEDLAKLLGKDTENTPTGASDPVVANDVSEQLGINWIYHPYYDFYITETEITVRQFKDCLDVKACSYKNINPNSGSFAEKLDDFPLNYISYFGAEEICSYIGGYICTQDEWNNACSGTDNRPYPYGKTFNKGHCNIGNYDDDADIEPVKARPDCEGGLEGLFDMGGNLSEWINEPNDPEDNYRKFKSAAYAQGSNINKKVCYSHCAGNQREFKSPFIGARCCKK